MTRFLYALAWLFVAPLAVVRLAWRSRRQPGYVARIGERFGRYDAVPAGPRIWIHAVSVGETRAAAPLVETLDFTHPGHRILMTHMTPTGRATAVELFGDRVEHAWLPYDLGFAVRAFVRHFRPAMGIVMETELWPRLLEECARQKVPVVLANARLSERSAARYARFPAVTRWALGNLAGIAAQTSADARRFTELGARGVAITGNVKFDLAVPDEALALGEAFRARFGKRPVWVAGSTREGEEALLLDALGAEAVPKDALLVIVPRHPQRFESVAELIAASGFTMSRRSAWRADAPPADLADVDVWLGDSMLEMPAWYALADVALLGGSFAPLGGQNLIEAAACGCPVVMGPHTFNFADAAERSLVAGAAVRVPDMAAGVAEAARIATHPVDRERLAKAALSFARVHRGAAARMAAGIVERLRLGG